MGTGPQLTPSGGWRRAQNLKAATSSRVGSPSRSPCPSSSSPVQLSSLHLLLLLSHIKSRCAGTSQRGNGGLHGARHLRHPRHARHARHPRRARSLGVEPGGEGGGCWEAKTLSRSNCHSPYFVVILWASIIDITVDILEDSEYMFWMNIVWSNVNEESQSVIWEQNVYKNVYIIIWFWSF